MPLTFETRRLAAVLADKRLQRGVDRTMLGQVRSEAERFSTDLADEALVRVEGLVVLLQHLRSGEGLSARCAIIARHSAVHVPAGN